ncbi:hypothetical protein ACHQM5_016673 [Ranunculus cassubicifolius]
MNFLQANGLKLLFGILGCLMVATLIYTIIIDGLPFRKEVLSPWMATTLLDTYIIVVTLAAWVSYKVPKWMPAVLWSTLLICFRGVTICTFIVVQLLNVSAQDPSNDPMYYVLVREESKNETQMKKSCFSVTAARILFIPLGCLQLGRLIYTVITDGSPFGSELSTPWAVALLVDFYINVVVISVWIVYKEAHWISALVWIILVIVFGSVATCAYMIVQLFPLSSQDPLYLVLLNSRNRDGFKMLDGLH